MQRKKQESLGSANAGLEKQLAERTLELERKNRELEIEAALEKVRVKALAMHKLADMLEICRSISRELQSLDVKDIRNVQTAIIYPEKGIYINYEYYSLYNKTFITEVDYSHPIQAEFVEQMLKEGASMVLKLEGEELREWFEYQKTTNQFSDPHLAEASSLNYYWFSIGPVALGISLYNQLNEDGLKLFKRFLDVFRLAYRRYKDIELALAQAREGKIELALERVRARTMAMQHSDELAETAYILFQQFRELGENPDQATIGIVNETERVIEYWVTIHGNQTSRVYKFPVDEPNVTKKIYKAWKKHEKSLVIDLSGKALYDFSNFRAGMGGAAYNPDEKRRIINVAFFSKGLINVQSTVERSLESLQLLERFANVFESTYTRFLDLKKAEAQARESQIELALERVRAKTMAMQHSDELLETSDVLFHQLRNLGETADQMSIAIVKEDEGIFDVFATIYGTQMIRVVHPKIDDPFVMGKVYKNWKAHKKSFVVELGGEKLRQYNVMRNQLGGRNYYNEDIGPDDRWIVSAASFSKGLLSFSSSKEPTKGASLLLERFAKVFEQTYTRFLDLQKAEAQSKESQIQLALERVRARTMAMQKSDELAETVSLLFKQLLGLGIRTEQIRTCGIVTFNDKEPVGEQWITETNGEIIPQSFMVPYNEAPAYKAIYKAWKHGEQFMVVHLEGKALKEHLGFLAKGTNVPTRDVVLPQQAKEIFNHVMFFSQGCLFIITKEALPDYHEVFKRFGAVFQQSYTRFLDLQKAEEQAREAKIEAGLERVRAAAMSMQTSEELNGLIGTVFGELTKLDFVLTRCLIMIFDPETKDSRWWMANSEAPEEPMNYHVQYHKHPANAAYLKAWKERILKWQYDLKGKVKKTWDDFLFIETELSHLPGFVITGMKAPERVILSASFNNFGCLTLVSLEPLSDEHFDLLLRFAKVFDMSYTRFNDLKQAEAQVREAQVQLALERVRARTMAMHQSIELAETSEVLFQQFAGLGIVPERVVIGIMIENPRKIDLWGTEQGGNKMGIRFELREDWTVGFDKVYNAWEDKKKTLTIVLKDKDLDHHVRYMRDVIGMPMQLELIHQQRVLYTAFFTKGFLMMVTNEAEPKETLEILERFAGVFDGTYTRFLDLQKAEAQAREAKIEAALERVRSRTMAMQKSDELREVIQLIYEQLQQLNFNVEVANFVMNYKESDDFNLWLAGPDQLYPTKIYIPYFNHLIFNHFIEAKEKGLDFYTLRCTFEEKNEFFNHFFKNAPEVPMERKEVIYSSPGYAQSSALIKNIILSIANYAAIPYSEAENAVLKRFANVFEQTYTRFNDLKQAEAQAKEAKIEAGLERVRAKAMAMHSSEDLAETISVFYHELGLLSVTPRRCGLGLMDKGTRYAEISTMNTTEQGESIEVIGKLNMTGHPVLDGIYDNWLLQKEYHPVLRGNEIKEYYQMVRPQISYPDYPNDIVQYGYFFFFRDGGAFTWTDTELPEDELKIYRRFNSVLSLTYRRYKDIKEAEAQAREAKIETALERVRSRTMAMFKSDELAETAAVLFQQFAALGIAPDRIFIGVFMEGAREMETWATEQGGNQISKRFKVRVDESTAFSKMYAGWTAQKKSITIVQQGKELAAYIRFLREVIGVPIKHNPSQKLRVQNIAFFSRGLIGLTTPDVQQPETISLIERFAGVFNLTYTRFLDLQKAEEQAREANIEAALERVRAAAMAMHDSKDVGNATALVFSELYKLGITTIRCGVVIIEESTQLMEVWSATSPKEGKIDQGSGKLDMTKHPLWQNLFTAWKQKKPVLIYELAGHDLLDYYKAISSAPGYRAPELDPDHTLSDYVSKARQYCTCFIFAEGGLFTFTREPFPPGESKILEKFAAVFSLTYRRYLELQKAEAQAREAQIEASLERVRGKAMAMRNSNDLLTAASTVFTELQNLGINQIRSGVGLIAKDFHKAKVYSATSSQSAIDLSLMGEVTLYGHPVFEQQYQSWLNRENYFVVLEGAALASYYKILSAGLNADLGVAVKKDQKEYGHWFMFSEGFLYAWSNKEYTDAEIRILERFKNVMELTIRRYIELQKSETQAREAIRQASLDRVRAEIASMRTFTDLEKITPLIWNELTTLGVPFIRCGVFIMDEQMQQIHTYLSTPDGKAIAAFQLPFNADNGNGVNQAALHGWRQKHAVTIHWTEEEFNNFSHTLVERGEIESEESYLTERPPSGLDLHFFPFLQGMLYAGNTEPLSDDDKDLVQSLADAFSTAYARYEDFNKLELAKQEVERTLTDLKAAQTRLVQSEKMASLGELTAGIAHEIQNPLNFVNNFSEVNQEMIDELEEELKAGNIEEALAIAADIKQNEQKINHHGKRADGIVKGMLQHSRSGGGEKLPTNINSVAEEYMRLSYHGLRAKDKGFNAEMLMNFDPELPRVEAVGQDIGRVFLNLFNNAFYAVNQKKKTAGNDYKPEVSVTTAPLPPEGGAKAVLIIVRDNGVGMPDHVKEKIMQPFFTTKPTGEGTGLGLSLTYDMVVKGHGGSIQVNSIEGEGSEFIVSLPIN